MRPKLTAGIAVEDPPASGPVFLSVLAHTRARPHPAQAWLDL